MGYIKHNAIIVTSWKDTAILEAAKQAKTFGLTILGPGEEAVNDYRTLLVCPDGSEEGWDESNRGDQRRELFREWLDAQAYEDGSTALEWVEVVYGSDDAEATIVANAWD